MDENDQARSETDWEKRTLCSDESCIGIIGSDGRCKECGLVFDGKLNNENPGKNVPNDGQDMPDQEKVPEELLTALDNTDWENRTLCIDESCIGIVGPDGKCKECGLPYTKEK